MEKSEKTGNADKVGNELDTRGTEGTKSSNEPNTKFVQSIFQQNMPLNLQNLDHKCSFTSCVNSSKSLKVPKRCNVVPWDDYFMSVAFLSAMRSKDPSTQVGACIVNPDKRIVGIG